MKFEKNIETKAKFKNIIKGNEMLSSTVIIDSKSIPTHNVFEKKGFDGNKKIKGVKLNIVVDLSGFILESTLTPANIHDTIGGLNVMDKCLNKYTNISTIIADKGYRGFFYNYFTNEKNIKVDINQNKTSGFLINSFRWIVERTFAWLIKNKRLVNVYERLNSSFLFFVKLANFRLAMK
jgi:transposase